jgi:hypothetical protein
MPTRRGTGSHQRGDAGGRRGLTWMDWQEHTPSLPLSLSLSLSLLSTLQQISFLMSGMPVEEVAWVEQRDLTVLVGYQWKRNEQRYLV